MKKATIIASMLLTFVQSLDAQHFFKDSLLHAQANEIALSLQLAPQEGLVYVSWEMPKPGPATLSVLDTEGHMTLHIPLKYVPQSLYSKAIAVQAFSAGTYLAVVSIGDKFFVQSFEIKDQASID